MTANKNYMVDMYICSKEEIMFVYASNKDPNNLLINKEYKLLAYFKNKYKGDPWHFADIVKTITLLGGVSVVDQNRLILVDAQSEVLRTKASDWWGDWESPIPPPPNTEFIYPIGSKGLLNGHLYIVSHNRGVYRRDGINQWKQLINGFPFVEDQQKRTAFWAIDGFTDDDLYAGGDNGDLWHWDGNKWSYVDIPTNQTIENIVCAENGIVYVTFFNSKQVLSGKNNVWRFIIIPDTVKGSPRSLIWFKDRIYINTGKSYDLYEIKNDTLIPSDLNNHKDAPSSWGHLMDARDGIMVIGDEEGTVLYDGTNIETLI